ncbi:MAG: zinc ribbon domain-containing protein [Coriobacteriales bacterium]|jgi:hypothetical protein|nr:zinc ribbon domain-containing protein [Coriobacteriales bacterium]
MCFRPPTFDEMMKKCPACGGFNQPDASVCKKCGEKLPESAAAGAPPPLNAPKGPGMPTRPGAPKVPGAPTSPAPPPPPDPKTS